MWSAETSCGREQDKIAAFVIPYTCGFCLDLGCGDRTAWPHMLGVDQSSESAATLVRSITDLSIFADSSVDSVFSSHALEDIEDTHAALAEWWRVVRPGGHLVLYLPHRDYYPNVGQPGANPAHKHDFIPMDIVSEMTEVARACGTGFAIVENETRTETNEYSFFQVYRKNDLGDPICQNLPWERNPGGKKRCLVVRFGAIGDMIQASTILPGLKEQGYHITMCCTPSGEEVVRNNPYIDDWWIQEKDQVPNGQLDAYFKTLRSRFDRIVNLCESVEGSLLIIPGRPASWLSLQARRELLGHENYLERQHIIAGVPFGEMTAAGPKLKFDARFYATAKERARARAWRAEFGGRPIVYWALSGTAIHKTYPFTQIVVGWLLQRTNAVIVLTGSQREAELAEAIIGTLKHDEIHKVLGDDTPLDFDRVVNVTGQWPLRDALTFCEVADVVVGPETGTLNAAALLPVPKVIMLSHSSHENLTKHWEKTVVLEPANCQCAPCHQLHYSWDDCAFVEKTAASLCASNIRPQVVYDAIAFALGLRPDLPVPEAAE